MNRTARRAWVAAVSLASGISGVLGAHVLDYRLIYRNPIVRAMVLSRTGHPYLRHVPGAIAVGVVVALAGMALLGWADTRRGDPRDWSLARLIRWLAFIQVVGFVDLEAFERLRVGFPIAQLLGPVLLVGVSMQILVATVAALVLHLLHRLGAVIARTFASSYPRVGAVPPAPAPKQWLGASSRPVEPFAPRGPPTPLVV